MLQTLFQNVQGFKKGDNLLKMRYRQRAEFGGIIVPFHRNCRACERKFLPNGKFCKLCDRCLKKAYNWRTRGKKE